MLKLVYLHTAFGLLYSPFWDKALEFWKIRNEPNVLFLTYEEMKRDLESVLKRVAAFLNKTLTEDQIEKLKDHLSFEKMKDNAAVNYEKFKEYIKHERPNADGHFIRQGKAGGWRNVMSKEIAEKFDKWADEKLADTGLDEIYGSKFDKV